MNRWPEWLITAAATLAAVIYLARKINVAIHKADEILALPASYRALSLTVEANTEAISELELAVKQLTAVERERGRQ